MDDLQLSLNFKELTPEQVNKINECFNKLAEFMNTVWDKVNELVNPVLSALKEMIHKVKEAIKQFILATEEMVRVILRLPGYKRMANRERFEYYESISEGKSNNWRKAHGLVLRRRG